MQKIKKTARKKDINNNTKMRIYTMVCLPSLAYGSESWTILTKYEIRITGAEMRY
jgi:hypothetical protein